MFKSMIIFLQYMVMGISVVTNDWQSFLVEEVSVFFLFIALQSHFNVSFHSAIDFCYNDPCQNGGKCVSLLSDFQCDCTPGWEGKDCGSGKYLLGCFGICITRDL